MSISYEDRKRIERYLNEADRYEKDSALKSRNSFFSWLRSIGLGYIIAKLLDMAWAAIKALLFL